MALRDRAKSPSEIATSTWQRAVDTVVATKQSESRSTTERCKGSPKHALEKVKHAFTK